MTTLRAAVVQMQHAATFDEALADARERVADAAARGADLVLLPEYFFLPRSRPSPENGGERVDARRGPRDFAARAADVRAALADASRDAGVVVAGNVIEAEGAGALNVLRAYDSGREVGAQAKVHPMPREAEGGIVGGEALAPFAARGVVLGGIVCADIFYPEVSRLLSLRGAEVLLNPVMSPYREVDPTKDAREAVYVARAWDAGSFVLKAGGWAQTQLSVVGRSLVAAPWGLLARYRDPFADETLVVDLDLDALRAFRASHRGFQARAPKAYQGLLDG